MTIQTDIRDIFNNDLINLGLAKTILVNGTSIIGASFTYSETIDGSDEAEQRVRLAIPGTFSGTVQLNDKMVIDSKSYNIVKIEPQQPGTDVLAYFLEGVI